MPEAVLVFIAPPSPDELARGACAAAAPRATRPSRGVCAIAATEVAAADEFDHVVVNDDAERAAAELAGIINTERKGT